MSEPGAGSDVAGIMTKAVKKGDEVRISKNLVLLLHVVFLLYIRANSLVLDYQEPSFSLIC